MECHWRSYSYFIQLDYANFAIIPHELTLFISYTFSECKIKEKAQMVKRIESFLSLNLPIALSFFVMWRIHFLFFVNLGFMPQWMFSFRLKWNIEIYYKNINEGCADNKYIYFSIFCYIIHIFKCFQCLWEISFKIYI